MLSRSEHFFINEFIINLFEELRKNNIGDMEELDLLESKVRITLVSLLRKYELVVVISMLPSSLLPPMYTQVPVSFIDPSINYLIGITKEIVLRKVIYDC